MFGVIFLFFFSLSIKIQLVQNIIQAKTKRDLEECLNNGLRNKMFRCVVEMERCSSTSVVKRIIVAQDQGIVKKKHAGEDL